jgi:hypothetical protein
VRTRFRQLCSGSGGHARDHHCLNFSIWLGDGAADRVFALRARLRNGVSIFGESAQNVPQRFELWGEEYAAAATYCQTRSITAVLFNLPG